jgi:hypothetical protein
MAKPDYAALFESLKNATTIEAKNSIKEEIYKFPEPLTDTEKQLFSFSNDEYIDDNPSNLNETPFTSYVGEYISNLGEHSGSTRVNGGDASSVFLPSDLSLDNGNAATVYSATDKTIESGGATHGHFNI